MLYPLPVYRYRVSPPLLVYNDITARSLLPFLLSTDTGVLQAQVFWRAQKYMHAVLTYPKGLCSYMQDSY